MGFTALQNAVFYNLKFKLFYFYLPEMIELSKLKFFFTVCPIVHHIGGSYFDIEKIHRTVSLLEDIENGRFGVDCNLLLGHLHRSRSWTAFQFGRWPRHDDIALGSVSISV